MGAITFSIDSRLVDLLESSLPLDAFVETGTFEGDTVAQIVNRFREVHTIEIASDRAAAAAQRFRGDQSVHVHHGDSAAVLLSLRETLRDRPVVYWLDAHYCDPGDASTTSQTSGCALLGELEAIGPLNAQSVVLIDDARYFLCAPPTSERGEEWPRLQQVLSGLNALSSGHEPVVINDVVMFYPTAMIDAVAEFARLNSIDWLAVLHRRDALEREREGLIAILDERLALISRLDRELREANAARYAGTEHATDNTRPPSP
jgi:hypothetical protein